MRKKLFFLGALAVLVIFQLFVLLHKPKLPPAAFDEPPAAPEEAAGVPLAQESAAEEPETVSAAAQRSLELELLGTLTNCVFPSAFIKDLRSGGSRSYRVGGSVQDARITRISKGEVILESEGRQHVLAMSGRSPGHTLENSFIRAVSPDTIVVNAPAILSDPRKIFRELRNVKVKPYYRDRKVEGLSVEGIEEDSILTSAGIRNKDVIKEVNDQKISSYQKALQVFMKARTQQDVKVTLLRGGELKQLSYRLQ